MLPTLIHIPPLPLVNVAPTLIHIPTFFEENSILNLGFVVEFK